MLCDDINNEKFNYMYEFEKHPKLTEFIQEMANTGRVPQEWTTFLETLNQALRIHNVVGRSEQLCDHPRSERSYIGQNMLRCNKCGKEFS